MLFALVIRTIWIEPFRISSSAMRPALESGDMIFVGKMNSPFSLVKGELKRGDIVLFRPDQAPIRDFLKRVIAIGGDRVAVKAGRVWINGEEITEKQLDSEACAHEKFENSNYRVCFENPAFEDFEEVKLNGNEVFLLGDLRTRSVIDLRRNLTWGRIPLSAIKGKALWIWLSFEPSAPGGANWFPQLRFHRMFRPI